MYPKMTKETFKSFEDYKKEVFESAVKVATNKTPEEITEEMLAVISSHKKRQ